MPGEARPLFQNSIAQLAALLRDGSVSSRGLLDQYVSRIERLNATINAFVYVDAGATKAADAADARFRASRPLSLLDGIPFAVKDNLLVKGCPAVWGSGLYASHVADHDELPVARLRSRGAVLIGKTNVPELALRGYTDNAVFGTTRNPWNPARTPGGSSGGAVAAVAAGLAPAALGTDGAGSIRRPCAHTGLVGLKPTVGRVRRGFGFPQLMFDFEVAGPIARDVAAVRRIFEILASDAEQPEAPKRSRILFVEKFGTAPVDPMIIDRCREAASWLRQLGHEVTSGALPFGLSTASVVFQKIIRVGLAMLARREPRFFELVAPDLAEQAQQGESLPATEYAELLEALSAFRVSVAQAFDKIDIIMTPTTAAQPWPAEDPYPPVIAGQPVGPRGHAIFTGWVNVCGHPAITLPANPDPDGMPIGFQLVGPPHGDELLLAVAQEFEAAHPFADRWPVLAV